MSLSSFFICLVMREGLRVVIDVSNLYEKVPS